MITKMTDIFDEYDRYRIDRYKSKWTFFKHHWNDRYFSIRCITAFWSWIFSINGHFRLSKMTIAQNLNGHFRIK